MDENSTSDAHELRKEDSDSAPSPSDCQFELLHSGNGAGKVEDGKIDESTAGALPPAGSNAARYRLFSPASLPISRSPCLTIPPGLSPTSLLESPVMLLDLKVEPSPTTGSFSMPQSKIGSFNSNSLSFPKDSTNTCIADAKSSTEFEFKPHTSGSGSIMPSSGYLASGLNYLPGKPFAQVPDRYEYKKIISSSMTMAEDVKASCEGFARTVPASVPPAHMVTLSANIPDEINCVELQHRQGPEIGTHPLHSDSTENNESKSVMLDKSSDDGYNWRKYGQKYVKGCEFPRSYYKCTHPNCQVKKLLERSHDGQITEVTYKGSHDHPKPLPGRRSAILPSQTEELGDGLSLISAEDKSSNPRQSYHIEPINNLEVSHVSASEDDLEVAGVRPSITVEDAYDDDEDDPESKRRKIDIGNMDVIPMIKATREPRVVVQTLSEVDILDDGYRWRKYGQKVVKGNPNPRSYYKCTNAGCPVRKHVERASHDPKAVITTYEGKHNHDVPTARTSSHDTMGPMSRTDAVSLNKHASVRPDEGRVSLDLGVGINLAPEKQQAPNAQAHNQMDVTGSVCSKLIQATPVSAYFGSLLR